MHISFSTYGKGSALSAANYLTQEKDHLGNKREEVKVLRGDPHMEAELADSLDFVNRYTTGVIAWAPEDRPTQGQIENVLDEFEKTAWAGLEPDRYSWSAVLHREAGGGCHVHVLSARVELDTGKSLNIAPPGHIQTFKHLRNWQNAEHGWACPDDPERALLISKPKHELMQDAWDKKQGLDLKENPREMIADYVKHGVEIGEVVDRKTVVKALHDAGLETPRQGEKYITARDPVADQRYRLKGVLFEKSWTVEQSLEIEDGAGLARSGVPDKSRAWKAKKELDSKRQLRARFNQHRYKTPSREIGAEPRPEVGSELRAIRNSVGRAKTQAHDYSPKPQVSSKKPKVELVETVSRGTDLEPSDRARAVGRDHLAKQQTLGLDSGEQKASRISPEVSGSQREVGDVRRETVYSDRQRLRQNNLRNWKRQQLHDRENGVKQHDGTGNNVARKLRKIEQSISKGHSAITGSSKRLNSANGKSKEWTRTLGRTVRRVSPQIERGLKLQRQLQLQKTRAVGISLGR